MTSVAMIILIALIGTSVGSLINMNNHLQKEILAMHNHYRRQMGAANMRYMEWDDKLWDAATLRAISCNQTKKGNFPYGENSYLADHVGHHRSIVSAALRQWVSKSANYTYGVFEGCDSTCEYTQLFWAKSSRLGCALSKCQITGEKYKKALFVCLYGPKGNILYELPFEKARVACSNCPQGTRCQKRLCVGKLFSKIEPPQITPQVAPVFLESQPPADTPVIQPITGVCARYQKLVCECKDNYKEVRLTTGHLDDVERRLLLEAHNNHRSQLRRKNLIWDESLETWARYVIRCEPLYPGPIETYTNFGKGQRDEPLPRIVEVWYGDGDVIKEIEPFCRTPRDSAVCNRNTNMMQEDLTRMACAAMFCGNQRQLTCIYK